MDNSILDFHVPTTDSPKIIKVIGVGGGGGNLGADLVTDEIFHISWNQDFTLEGREGSYRAKAVLLATGTSRKKADIEGLSRLEGHGVSYCAICDAFFYRGRKVAVLGNEEYAVHELAQLLPVAGSAALLTDGKELKAEVPEGVQVITKKIRSVDGEEAVTGVTFADGERLPADGLFVALGSAGAVDLARKVGALTDGRSIQVDEAMATNVPGLFAAGDCTGGLLQISTAVGEGAGIRAGYGFSAGWLTGSPRHGNSRPHQELHHAFQQDKCRRQRLLCQEAVLQGGSGCR